MEKQSGYHLRTQKGESAATQSAPAQEALVASGPVEAAWLSVVERKVHLLRFGLVQITIHDGKVVQIDSTERTRFDLTAEHRPRLRNATKKGSPTDA